MELSVCMIQKYDETVIRKSETIKKETVVQDKMRKKLH